jgi:hypothetical protein
MLHLVFRGEVGNRAPSRLAPLLTRWLLRRLLHQLLNPYLLGHFLHFSPYLLFLNTHSSLSHPQDVAESNMAINPTDRRP